MAITDNLISHIYAEPGDTVVTDKIQAVATSGTGTATLTTVGAEDAWNLAAFDHTLSLPSFSYNPAGSTSGGGFSFAFRYRINTFGSTGGYNAIVGVGQQRLTKNGAGMRSRYASQQTVSVTGAGTTATVKTVVHVVRPNRDETSSDYTEVWINQASRGTNDPDFTAGPSTNSSDTITSAQIVAPDTMDYDLLDFVYWDRELTDAEAAAVADDLRTELPVGGGSDTTPDAFSFTDQTDVAVSTLTTSNTVTITGIDTATAISVTGGEMSINSGAFTSSSTTVNVNDTVQLRVTSSASNSTAVAVTLDVGGVTDEWTVTTVAASVGTITTGPFKNNTGTPQTGLTGLRVVVLDPTDGTTVLNSTGNTTHATTAVLTLSDAALTPATTYGVITLNTAGTTIGAELITAT